MIETFLLNNEIFNKVELIEIFEYRNEDIFIDRFHNSNKGKEEVFVAPAFTHEFVLCIVMEDKKFQSTMFYFHEN